MARRRQREKVARKLLAKYVKDVQFETGLLGHALMVLTYTYGHKIKILQTKKEERDKAGKLSFQAYNVRIFSPDGTEFSKNEFLTAKMVKMTIMKTKALDILKSVKGVNTWA